VLTIGSGHVITRADAIKFKDGISKPIALALLSLDAAIAERAVQRAIKVPLSQAQFDALVSFTFNLGGGALYRSTLRQVINRGDMEAAPAQFRKWVWAGGRKLPGLIRRRAEEARIFAGEPSPADR
jgi:GH24 family phage-related lysozyme (muramidase)